MSKVRIMLRSSLSDYRGTYILVKGTTTFPNKEAAGAATNNVNNKVIFKTCAAFVDYISEVSNAELDHSIGIVAVMPIYNLLEHGDNNSKTSGSLWQYYRDKPSLTDADAIQDFTSANQNSKSFNLNLNKK